MNGNGNVRLRCSYLLENGNGVINIYRNTSTGQKQLNTVQSSAASGEISIEITYYLNFTNSEKVIEVYCGIILYDNYRSLEPIYSNRTCYIRKNFQLVSVCNVHIYLP